MTTRTQTYDVDIADVEYLSHGDTPLLARLFKPRGSGPFPIMIELHGGAWVRGTRLNGDTANEALAKNGVIVAALDFRTEETISGLSGRHPLWDSLVQDPDRSVERPPGPHRRNGHF